MGAIETRLKAAYQAQARLKREQDEALKLFNSIAKQLPDLVRLALQNAFDEYYHMAFANWQLEIDLYEELKKAITDVPQEPPQNVK